MGISAILPYTVTPMKKFIYKKYYKQKKIVVLAVLIASSQ